MIKIPSISIVIANYNGVDDTIESILSLKETEYPNFNIIIVDNNSKDNSHQILGEMFPDITIIPNQVNLGFTGGNNTGFSKAFELATDYIFCLNNDTTVSRNILDELTSYMESNQDVGLIGPLTCYYDDQETIAFAGGSINRNTGLCSFVHKGEPRVNIKEDFISCTFVEGAALFIRSDLLKKIGGFNDDYFLTSEESELCVKVHDAGYKLGVLTTCCMWHKISKSMVAESELANYFIFRNKLHFVRNNRRDFSISDLIAILRYYFVCFLSISLKKRNFKACKGLITGVIDFIAGRTGAGRFSKVLQK